MNKNWEESIAKENYTHYKDYAKHRGPWERDAKRFDDFRYGSHFSRAEEEQLLAFKQAPLPISITTAICDTAEALMVSSKPIIKVAPIVNPFNEQQTMISKKVAQKYDFLLKKSWHDSLGSLQHDRVIRDYNNVGHGLYYIVPSNKYGQFSVDIKHLSWRYYYPDPLSKDPFYRDADAHITYMEISEIAAYKFVKRFENGLSEDNFKKDWVKGNIATVGGERVTNKYDSRSVNLKSVPFIQRSVIEEQTMYVIVPRQDSEMNKTNMDIKYRRVSEITPELQELITARKVKVVEERKMVLTEYTSVGNMGYKEVYPISSPNIVPLVYDHRDNPYPIGRVHYLYPLQRALNKFMMIAILNGTLMNATRVIAEEDSIIDLDEWKSNASIPGSVLRYKLPVPGYSTAPTVIEAKPLGEAWLAMPRYLTYIMEYISGIFGSMMGDSTNSPDVFSTVASLQSAGGQKIKRRAAQADATLSVVGQVVAEFYQHYAPLNGYSTIIDENGDQSAPEVYNRVVRSEDGKSVNIDPESDLSIGFNSVRFTSQGSAGHEAATEAALLTNLATQLKVPQIVPLILKRLNIADVDKIMKDIDLTQKQAGQIDQMEKTISDLEGRTKVLANQVTQKAFELSKSQFDSKFTKLLAALEKQGVNVDQEQLSNQMNGGQ